MTTLTPAKIAQLRAVLRALPPALTVRIVEAAAAGDEAMGRLLAACSKDAEVYARERFFAPLAALSLDPAHARPSLAHVPPAMLATVWTWLDETLAPDIVVAMRAQCANPLLPPDMAQEDALRARASAQILSALADVEDDPRASKLLRRRLGVSDFRAVCDLATILRAAPVLRAALQDIPMTIRELTEDLSKTLRDRYEEACQKEPDAGVWLLYLVMARLMRPWTILRVFEKIARREDDFLLSRTDVATIGNALLEDAAFHVSGFAEVPATLEAAHEMARALTQFATVTIGMSREIGIRKDGGWGRQILALRQRASAQMEAIHAAAIAQLDKALPDPRKALLPHLKLSGAALETAAARMEVYCTFLRLTRDDASRAAVSGAHAAVLERVDQRITMTAESLLGQMRANADDRLLDERAGVVARLMGALGQQEAASVFLRRAAAARAA
jgi:hypothetical protein